LPGESLSSKKSSTDSSSAQSFPSTPDLIGAFQQNSNKMGEGKGADDSEKGAEGREDRKRVSSQE
jgi:hypothetical protein